MSKSYEKGKIFIIYAKVGVKNRYQPKSVGSKGSSTPTMVTIGMHHVPPGMLRQ